jgi:hypoxanthine phosphoribosyltransferase
MGDDKAVARIEKNARKEGGQVLIEGDFSPTAADLSDFQPDTNTISPDTGRVNFAPAILPTEEEIKALPKLIKKSSPEANQLVADKKAWEASGHSREQAEAIISKYYQPKAFADIPANAILVPMPSRSGKNILPKLLAQRIAQDRGAMDFQPDVAAATARKEAKHKTSFWQKIEDPVAYQSLEGMDQLKALASEGRPIYIVEDIHTTGESWMAMRQLLKEEGIDPAGVAVLAANDTHITTAADIERAAQKYAAASGSSLDEARAIVHPFLYGRFRKIAQKLEQSLGGKDAPQAAQRLAALARLHARERAAEREASSRISGEVSQAGDLGDLSQTPPSQAPSAPAINDPTVPLHSRLRAYLLYADIVQKFSHAKNLARLEKRAGREGGLVLISDASAPVAVDLSDVPSGKFNLPKPHPRQRRH